MKTQAELETLLKQAKPRLSATSKTVLSAEIMTVYQQIIAQDQSIEVLAQRQLQNVITTQPYLTGESGSHSNEEETTLAVGTDAGKPHRKLPVKLAVAGAIAAVAVVSVAFSGTAPWVSHFFAGEKESEAIPYGEYWDTGSPQLKEGILKIYPKYVSLANGYDKKSVVEEEVRAAGKTRALRQPIGFIRDIEDAGRCTWLGQWIADAEDGNQAGMAKALAAYRQAASWPAIKKTDGGGIVEANQSVIPALENKDLAKVKQQAIEQCDAKWLTPKGETRPSWIPAEK